MYWLLPYNCIIVNYNKWILNLVFVPTFEIDTVTLFLNLFKKNVPRFIWDVSATPFVSPASTLDDQPLPSHLYKLKLLILEL